MLYFFQNKGTGVWCTTVLREGNRCSTVFRIIEKVHYSYQEKETGALLFSGEGIW